jgi:alpha-galactosidase
MQAAAADHPDDPEIGNKMMKAAYLKMRAALDKTGRPIIYSLCQYGDDDVWKWGPDVGGNLWRTTGDIQDNYDRMAKIGFGQAGLAKYAAPGHWNDPDMLEIGNGGMKIDAYKTQISLWAILAAPLIASNDVRTMTPEIRDILINRDVIAVDQDVLGRQGDRVRDEGPLELWAKPLADGSRAVAVFNRGRAGMEFTFTFRELGFPGRVAVRDLWLHQDLGFRQGAYTVFVPKYGVAMFRVSPVR